MDITNVFIIVGNGWNVEKVISELQDEGYNHNFFIGKPYEYEVQIKNIDFAKEVWLFGNVDLDNEVLEYAKSKGKDLWQMG